jgi:hypothetical protein
MRHILVVPVILSLAGCGGGESERVPREAPPAAAVIAPGQEAALLTDQLEDLETELELALAGSPERLLPAEAITDRLLHARRPFDWLATGYDVEARLRQIQSLADRVVAPLRRGAPMEEVDVDIRVLLASARDLREQLGHEGGGPAPPTLDSLLAQDPLRDVSAPSMRGVTASRDSAAAARDSLPVIEPTIEPARGLLGSPIQRPPDTLRVP